MSEADWWLCSRCSSLNNLAARKCYRCNLRKPKDAALASDVLGYVPVVSWDGKVRLEDLPRSVPRQVTEAPRRPPAMAPIRDPIRRDVLAIAPRPPRPATITYRSTQPAPPARPPGTSGQPLMQPPPTGAPLPPLVPVGPGPPPPVQGNMQSWPHWRELLDAPVPDAHRLRTAPDVSGVDVRAMHSERALSRAIRRARGSASDDDGEFIAWPTKDRAPDEPDSRADDSEPISP